jgi:hypothetical protein
MLRGNLSSRPFYNERLVNALLIGGFVIGVALTIFNVRTILEYSGERTLRTAVQRDAEAETAQLKSATDSENRSVDRDALSVLGYETSQANALIDQRLFSWTVFFGLVEKTLPLDVRVVAVAPHVERGQLLIDMTVNAKRRDDIAVFLDALQSTGAFYSMNAGAQQRNDDGSYDATLSGAYVAPVVHASKTTGAAGGAKRP